MAASFEAWQLTGGNPLSTGRRRSQNIWERRRAVLSQHRNDLGAWLPALNEEHCDGYSV